MPVPDYQTLMLPVLKLFAEGKQSIPECIEDLKQQFNISDEEAEELLPSGKMTYLFNRAHWARTYLGKAGLLESPKRGQHQITQLGLDILAKNPTAINNKMLAAFSDFSEWRSRDTVGSKDELEVHNNASTIEFDQTPEDQIQSASKILDAALRDDLLTALLQVSPTRFERLILDLLKSMGFGRSKHGQSILTPVSGDGGIDGIINEDALGLDAVYIQAKRYAPENRVSRPDIQRFVGSLTGESATKGVFVTTSDFSKEAKQYVERVQQRVILINGRLLADLMIEHDVGVRTRTTYLVKSIDDDYFTDI
ncbi:restriction endonuclease [Ascidiaceihabitans sp.]|uniref:restriction endonuclease n=1 Tax=Ascidiaceihabitans sp. TaxID=1872644 RepID=UPI003297E0BB